MEKEEKEKREKLLRYRNKNVFNIKKNTPQCLLF